MNPASHHPEEKLLDYAYDELSAAESKTVEAHVRSCPQCADSLTSMKRVRQTMSQLPIVPAPSKGLDSLRAYAEQAAERARARANRSRGWMQWLVPVTGIAALSVVLVISTNVIRMGHSTGPSESGSPVVVEPHRALPAEPSDQAPSSGVVAASEPPRGETASQENAAFEKRPNVNSEPLAKRAISVPPAKAAEGKPSAQGVAASPAPAPAYDLSERRVAAEEARNSDRKDQAKQWAIAPPKGEHGNDATGRADGRDSAERMQSRTVGSVSGVLGGAVRQPALDDKQPVAKGMEGGVVGGAPGGVVGGIAEHEAVADKQGVAKGGVVGNGAAKEDALSEKQRAPDEFASREADTARDEGHAAAPARKAAAVPAAPAAVSNSLNVQAAEARKAGDREQEVELLRQALASGARGPDRARLLGQLCDALDALKRQAEADSACNDLIREFPNSDEAKAAVQRQTLRSKAKQP